MKVVRVSVVFFFVFFGLLDFWCKRLTLSTRVARAEPEIQRSQERSAAPICGRTTHWASIRCLLNSKPKWRPRIRLR